MRSLRLICVPLAGFAMMALLSGCGDTASPTGPSSALDTTPPPAPVSITYTHDSQGQPAITWSASPAPDVVSYEVYLYSPSPDRDNSYIIVSDTNATDNQYTLPSTSVAEQSTYRVRAIDSSGNKSAYSAAATVWNVPSWGGGGTGQDPTSIPD